MINRLIDINVIPQVAPKPISKEIINASITDYAISFIEGLGDKQRDRFKKMLENGIESGQSVAKAYNIDYDKFITEVKKLLLN